MPDMTLARFNEHWRNLQVCEQGGVRPAVYRELLEEITRLRAKLIELQLKPDVFYPYAGDTDA